MSAGYRLQVTSYRLHAQVIGCMQQAASYKLQATGYKLQAASNRQHTSCRLQAAAATGYKCRYNHILFACLLSCESCCTAAIPDSSRYLIGKYCTAFAFIVSKLIAVHIA